MREIEAKAMAMMSPAEVAFLLGVDEERLRDDIATYRHPARLAYMRGLAKTAYKLRTNMLELAEAGSPNAINESNRALTPLLSQLDTPGASRW